MCVRKTVQWGEDSSVKSHSWLCSLKICVHVHMFVPIRAVGIQQQVQSSDEAPLKAWAGDHDLVKCHSAYGFVRL